MLTAERLWLEAEIALQTIATIKERPAWETALEERVLAVMQREFDAATGSVIETLTGASSIPTGDLALAAILQPLYVLIDPLAAALLDGAMEAAEHGQDTVAAVAAQKQLNTDVIVELRENTFQASQRTIDRVVGDVIENLVASQAENVSVREAAVRLRDAFTAMRDWELRRVARTEIVGAENEATFESLQELGVEYHQWWSARDSRVRDSHADLHGEIVAVGEPFSNGLRYPGERSGPIEEWINCRCKPIPYLMPEEKMPPAGARTFTESDLIDVV